MKILLSLALFFASNISHADTKKIIKELTTVLKMGNYSGKTSDGKICNASVYISESTYSVSLTPGDFRFEKDEGSTECMYSKACFQLKDDYFNYKVLQQTDTASNYFVQVKRAGGGPDGASAKKMSVTFTKASGGLKVAVEEQVGIFGLGSTKANCTLSI